MLKKAALLKCHSFAVSSKFQKLKMVFPRRKEQMIIPGIFCFFFGVHSEQKNFESHWKHC